MTGVLRKLMVVFGVFFVLLGIMISQAFMLAGFLLVALYFVFDVLSRKEYEYILDGKTLTIDVIYGKRYRKTAHIIDMTEMGSDRAKPPRGCGKVPQRRGRGPTAEV